MTEGRLPFSDGDRPESTSTCWPERRLKTVAREVTDLSADGTEELLTVSHLTGVTPRAEKTVYMFQAESNEGYKRVQRGDLVVNTMWAWMGALGVARTPGIVSPAYGVYRLDEREVDPRFVEALLRTPSRVAEMAARSTGVWTSRLRLYADQLLDMRLRLPPLGTQRVIADYLDAETARIDALVRARRETAALVSLRLDVITRLRVTTDGQRRAFPVLPLRRRWQVIDCKHRTPVYQPDGFPIVSPGDATPGRLELTRCTRFVDRGDFDDLTEEPRRPRRGDVIYTRNASIGIASYVGTDQAFSMGQDVCLIRSTDQDQRYLTYVLNTLGLDQLEEQKIGSTFSRINVARVLELLVPCPPAEEQGRIADGLDEAVATVSQYLSASRQQVDLLLERRQALITAAVTGQLDIPGVAA